MTFFEYDSNLNFLSELKKNISGSTSENRRKRIEGLIELQKRIVSNSIKDENEVIQILLEFAEIRGESEPESKLIIDCLLSLVQKDDKNYQIILTGLKGQENRLLVFSKLIFKLNHTKKREGIKPLVNFLMSRDAINDSSVSEVKSCLINLGNENLSTEIIKEVAPLLDSFNICQIVFSTELCATFANEKLLNKLLIVLKRSMTGFFSGYENNIEENICQYLDRIANSNSLDHLIKLLKLRKNPDNYVNKAITSVLDSNPSYLEFIYETLYDERDEYIINSLLRSLEKMEKTKIDPRKLLTNIRICWVRKAWAPLHRILIKEGDSSKSVLFDMLQSVDEEKYTFALRCLKVIGISKEEISAVFKKPVMWQIYNYFFKQKWKNAYDLYEIWDDKTKLERNVPGKTNFLEHLLLHIFISFNFTTMNLAYLRLEGIDIISFYPDTLDLLLIGCTTGVLKTDLSSLAYQVKKMKTDMPKLVEKVSVTPIVVCSKNVSIYQSDKQYANENNIKIMTQDHIDTLLEILSTNRQPRKVIDYIKSVFSSVGVFSS